jgi:hypothetical protein
MAWSRGRLALGAAANRIPHLLLAAACAMALAACNQDGRPGLFAGQPRGATVSFESIDGPPPGQFQKLVHNLNEEAQSRRLAVISRESPSAYRVRGSLTAKVAKGQTTIAWVWDVFDADERRALRITGEETANSRTLGRPRDAWTVADDAMLQRIARTSMDQLAAFLTSPTVAPSAPATAATPAEAPVVFVGARDSSPESAGIFRIFRAHADPVPSQTAEAPGAADDSAGPVPLPRRRPPTATSVSAREMLTLAASSQH